MPSTTDDAFLAAHRSGSCAREAADLRTGVGRMALPFARERAPHIEDAIGWPPRRIASVLGGAAHLRHTQFARGRG